MKICLTTPAERALALSRDGESAVMVEEVVIEPMSEQFLLWRCLHGGPLSCTNIDQWPSGSGIPWERYRERNIPLLMTLTRIYGACAIVARDGDRIVGHLRFYPRIVCGMEGAGGLCLQQDHPSGPADTFGSGDFPFPARIGDKVLAVHCLMTGCSQQRENPYQRKGIGTRMVLRLIQWARENGWDSIEADSFEDLPIIYDITGCAGHTFWEKLGFVIAHRSPHPHLQDANEFVAALEEQGRAFGIPRERVKDRIVMRLYLNPNGHFSGRGVSPRGLPRGGSPIRGSGCKPASNSDVQRNG